MWFVIFGLICFWSGTAALLAHIFGWPVIPIVLIVAVFAAISLALVGTLSLAAGTWVNDDSPTEIQAYFGGTFAMERPKHQSIAP